MMDCLKQQVLHCRQVLDRVDARLAEIATPWGMAMPKLSALLGQMQLKIAELLARQDKDWGSLTPEAKQKKYGPFKPKPAGDGGATPHPLPGKPAGPPAANHPPGGQEQQK